MYENDMADGPGKRAPDDGSNQRGRKIAVILGRFLAGATLNRFEAERHHDHCLHSTVATLESLGVVIGRKWETVPGLGGRATVRCKRYWLEATVENLVIAKRLMGVWRAR